MSSLTQHIYSPNLLSICVDAKSDHDFSGKIWDLYHEEPYLFDRAMEMVLHADDFFDEISFPQRANQFRTFSRSETLPRERRPAVHKDKIRDMDNLEEKKGNLGTFIVQVKYRQNSTWQGQVIWAEEEKKVYFRSALELLRLIDDATMQKQKEESEETPAEWEKQTGDGNSPDAASAAQ